MIDWDVFNSSGLHGSTPALLGRNNATTVARQMIIHCSADYKVQVGLPAFRSDFRRSGRTSGFKSVVSAAEVCNDRVDGTPVHQVQPTNQLGVDPSVASVRCRPIGAVQTHRCGADSSVRCRPIGAVQCRPIGAVQTHRCGADWSQLVLIAIVSYIVDTSLKVKTIDHGHHSQDHRSPAPVSRPSIPGTSLKTIDTGHQCQDHRSCASVPRPSILCNSLG